VAALVPDAASTARLVRESLLPAWRKAWYWLATAAVGMGTWRCGSKPMTARRWEAAPHVAANLRQTTYEAASRTGNDSAMLSICVVLSLRI